ncbi:hypothetical protein E2C01_005949 [Portunus trituberculatus]|uniref:Uncharacterized protein n=1 Tax=Portunus trituberculatus TaxID=210409 RepID=A0A5B7CWT7_PORTR|nr:hypothetical protein [Portunus trituberculatus]
MQGKVQVYQIILPSQHSEAQRWVGRVNRAYLLPGAANNNNDNNGNNNNNNNNISSNNDDDEDGNDDNKTTQRSQDITIPSVRVTKVFLSQPEIYLPPSLETQPSIKLSHNEGKFGKPYSVQTQCHRDEDDKKNCAKASSIKEDI